MKTRDAARPRRAAFTAAGGGWTAVRRPEPGLEGKTDAELLALGAVLPGNLRYTTTPEGSVILVGEVRSTGDAGTFEDARNRLGEWLEGSRAGATATSGANALEAALDASGFTWARREQGWAIPANENLPRELQISEGPSGVRVEATLTEWDEIGEAGARALARFLLAAQGRLRFARCELDGKSARVVAQVEPAYLDADLTHALTGVAVGCRLLAREAAALLIPEAARAYLEFHGISPQARAC
jgi:hypothetical protein